MQDVYQKHQKFYVALDSIIFGYDSGDLKILLIKRGFEPEKGKWSLMGGFLTPDESLNQAAQRILHQLTGLPDVYMEQLYAYGDIHRDPVARTISIAYYALIKKDSYDHNLAESHGAKWFPISDCPELIFDHQKMVTAAHNRLKKKTRTQPIGFELLPEKFTIPQLRGLYEAINQTRYDPRNFSKKLHSMKLLVKLEEKDKTSSKKGAYYYKFDKQKYDEFVAQGYNFAL
ncbi:MAG: NUDIX hydrolase [Candidatus Cyclobacteriaceae bacterium M3_2C_046]